MISKENHQQREEKDLMRKEKAGAVTEEKVATRRGGAEGSFKDKFKARSRRKRG